MMQESNRMNSSSSASSSTATATSPRSSDQNTVAPSIMPRIIAGSVGSIVTALAVTPLEVVKVRQQMSNTTITATSKIPSNVMPCPNGCGTFVLNNGIMDCVLPKSAVNFFDKQGNYCDLIPEVAVVKNSTTRRPAKKNLGTFAMLRRIFMQDGVSGIYAGLAPTLVMSVPNTVLYFSSYDEIVSRLRRRFANEASWIPLVSGASARLIASTITAPLELIRTRQASLIGQSGAAPGLWGEFRILCQTEGFASLFTGLGPTLWRDVPFSAIYWFCIEEFKLQWKKRSDDGVPVSNSVAAAQMFINGGAAGMIASCATTPFDVVKTRRQTAELLATPQEPVRCHHNGAAVYEPPASTCSRARQMSTFATMKEIVHTDGITALWRGNQTRMIKVAPACAIMISCYELGKRMME